MGFPEWTLWGMGLSIAGALVALVLSLLGQSPGALRRLGLGGSRLELRIRALTGYALALLLLAIGFFIAGVPLGPQTNQDTPSAQLTSAAAGTADTGVAAAGLPTEPISTESLAGSTATPATPETGAFGGPPPATVLATAPAITITETVQAGGPVSPTTSVIGVTGTPTAPPTATPTSTPTPTPEATPTPSLTPTPIAGDTAVVATGGSTIWLLRSPGGQNLALMHDADIVILLPGHANQGGILWREVSALSGIHGWIQEEFLVISD